MELQTAIEILEYHQEWRLGKREEMIHEAKKLTQALDVVVNQVKSNNNNSLLLKIKTFLEQYRDEEMPDWNTPFHCDAEGWASMKYFINWLEDKGNDYEL
jgi:hypothetical protein